MKQILMDISIHLIGTVVSLQGYDTPPAQGCTVGASSTELLLTVYVTFNP